MEMVVQLQNLCLLKLVFFWKYLVKERRGGGDEGTYLSKYSCYSLDSKVYFLFFDSVTRFSELQLRFSTEFLKCLEYVCFKEKVKLSQ
jgi:hypothetical protein